MKKIIALVLTSALLLLSLSACSGNEENPSDSQSTPEPVVFTVSTNTPFSPFEFVGEDGKIYGIDIEIAAGFAATKGCTLAIKDVPFDSVLLNVQNGYADIAMAGLTIKEDRLKTNDFTDTYFHSSQKLIVKADDTTFDECTTADDVTAILAASEGKKVGAQNGTTGEWFWDDFANVACSGYEGAAMAVLDLLNGNLDFVMVDADPANALVAANPGTKVVDIPLTDEDYAFGVKKGNAQLVADFNAYLAEIKANGTFQKIVDKYFGKSDDALVGYNFTSEQ